MLEIIPDFFRRILVPGLRVKPFSVIINEEIEITIKVLPREVRERFIGKVRPAILFKCWLSASLSQGM